MAADFVERALGIGWNYLRVVPETKLRSRVTIEVTSPEGELFAYGDYTAVCSPIDLGQQGTKLLVRARGVIFPGDSELMSTGVDSHFRVHEICRL